MTTPFAKRLRRVAGRAKRGLLQLAGYHAPPPPDDRVWFSPSRIDELTDLYFAEDNGQGVRWEPYRHAHMVLPPWFVQGLDPWTEAYAAQQERLWKVVSGRDRPYQAAVDEKEHSWGDIDVIRTPGFLVRRDPEAVRSAADHTLASGMILKHSGVQHGDWALEYGAGFGQTALTLARLGVNVDTVDISATLCEYVRIQAEHFRVPLTAFEGPFGMSPRRGQKYDLVWFYESFHHCVDFKRVVPQLDQLLAEGGRIILAGEPIVERENDAVPYPWGIRLHSEVVAAVRTHGWFELGFSEEFLYSLFARSGFSGRRIDCEPSLFGRLHVFERQGAADRPPTSSAPLAG